MEKEKNRHYCFIKLLLLFIWITASFALSNSWGCSKTDDTQNQYLINLQSEIDKNNEELNGLIDIIDDNEKAIRELSSMLTKEEYNPDVIIKYSARMSFSFEFNPHSAAYDTLKASQIYSDNNLMNTIDLLYREYKEIRESDQLHVKYIDDHISPYLRENIDMINGKALNNNFYKTEYFRNILEDYLTVLSQRSEAYKRGIEMSIELKEMLPEKN
jgi:hypothetical protein